MTFRIELPSTRLADAALAVVRRSEDEAIVNHSVRSYLFAELLAEHQGLHADPGYDRELLFAATAMHDLGTSGLASGKERFEVEGADLAAEILSDHGVPQVDVDRVWEAIALHTSPGIAERRGLLAYLTAEGSKMDIGFHAHLTESHQAAIHAAYPRLHMVKSLTDAVVDHAGRSETAAPIYSMEYQFRLERRANGATQLERLVAGRFPWGE
ncbi:HD domain-containing protein [Nocardia amamiensis]|uniref:HD domain-containing protein n=1 Tax=Nocardia amamiensis TaxID=404578 RepID=A0ABS0CNF1_9NOCA|nr:HD domain-containing protein [Nocardia amamiensis]MBF6298137.1 HD domain-containing protein [Nocardia amamiensis]